MRASQYTTVREESMDVDETSQMSGMTDGCEGSVAGDTNTVPTTPSSSRKKQTPKVGVEDLWQGLVMGFQRL